jgi:DNA-binding Lrp family transcriptional regulator
VRDVVWTIYPKQTLSQLIRVGANQFTNKDVQKAFKISAQGARNRIRTWEECGAVKQIGTKPSESDAGGAPAHQYAIADPRILRLVERELYDPEALIEAPIENDEVEP